MQSLKLILATAILVLFSCKAIQADARNQMFCVETGILEVYDFNENLPLEVRENVEMVGRDVGNFVFKLTIVNNNDKAEMDFEIAKYKVKLLGDVTFQNSNHINLHFDYKASYELGLVPFKPNNSIFSIVVNKQDFTYIRSSLIADIRSIAVSGGKCHQL